MRIMVMMKTDGDDGENDELLMMMMTIMKIGW